MPASLRTLIVDDEAPAIAGMRALLSAHDGIAVVGEARGGNDAIRKIRALAPDLVLLDVQMPEVGGFDVLRAIGPELMPAVVFVTAYDEFAVKAFDVQAVDYLVKPVSEERLLAALARARSTLDTRTDATLGRRLRALLDDYSSRGAAPAPQPQPPRAIEPPPAPPTAKPVQHLLVRIGSRDVLAAVGDIEWIEADDYCAVLHSAGKHHLVRESLAALESKLDPADFVRIHRSAIVRVARIAELNRHPSGRLFVVLRDGTRLPVSRSRRAQLAAALGSAS